MHSRPSQVMTTLLLVPYCSLKVSDGHKQMPLLCSSPLDCQQCQRSRGNSRSWCLVMFCEQLNTCEFVPRCVTKVLIECKCGSLVHACGLHMSVDKKLNKEVCPQAILKT